VGTKKTDPNTMLNKNARRETTCGRRKPGGTEEVPRARRHGPLHVKTERPKGGGKHGLSTTTKQGNHGIRRRSV